MNLAAPNISRRQAISLLALFGFRGDESERLVGTLSGGERRRVLLAMALTGSANLLLLDEPTNHLDIESREALEAAIAEFQGTVILISHDRALIEGIATRTIVLHDETIVTAPGGYENARRILANEQEPTKVFAQQTRLSSATNRNAKQKPKSAQLAAPKVASTGGKAPRDTKAAASPPASTPAASGEKRTVRRSDAGGTGNAKSAKGKKQVKRVRRPATIEMEIEQLEKRHGEVQQQMLDPEIYTSPEQSAKVLDEHTALERDIANRYEELESALEFHGS
jgi:ATP-binding cassette subfamily F protein 3